MSCKNRIKYCDEGFSKNKYKHNPQQYSKNVFKMCMYVSDLEFDLASYIEYIANSLIPEKLKIVS